MWRISGRPWPGPAWLVGLSLLALAAAPRADGRLRVSCHIHPPDVAIASAGVPVPAGTIGPFLEQTECEAARARLFGSDGRCHCAPGFDRPRPAVPEAVPVLP